jgi:hypothetical protein
MYPYLEAEDIDEALKYAAWRVEEIDVPILTGVAWKSSLTWTCRRNGLIF